MSHKRVLLIDSFGILFRSYFALEKTGLATKNGEPTFAIYGFFRAFFKAVQEIKPTDIIFTLESRTSIRKNLDPQYKAHRKEQPQALLDQITLFHSILERTALPSLSIEGYEADDVLATLAAFYKQESSNEIYIYTSDKDIAQLVDERTFLVQPAKTIAQPLHILNTEGVIEKFGVKPEQIRDYLAIIGDVADNIKGVDGVGPKTASKLLQDYGTLAGILAHLPNLSANMQNKFRTSTQILELSQALVTLHQDYSIIKDNDIGVLKKQSIEELKKVFTDLEFSAFKEFPILYTMLLEKDPEVLELFSAQGEISPEIIAQSYDTIDNNNSHYHLITTITDLIKLKESINTAGYFCFDTETTGLDLQKDSLLGVSFCLEEKVAFYVPVGHLLDTQVTLKDFQEIFKDIFESSTIKKIGHNLKYDYQVLQSLFPNFDGIYFDTMLAAYLLKPDDKRYGLDELSLNLCGYEKIHYKDLVNTKLNQNLISVDIDKVKDYACEDADLTYRLYLILKQALVQQELDNIFYSIEMPLVKILAHMELEGIGVDIPYFNHLEEIFKSKLSGIEKNIFTSAQEEINLNSPKQVSGLLYDTLKLPKPKAAGRSKSIFATDEDSLQALSEFSIVQDILEYRKYNKLLTTYVVPMVNKAQNNHNYSFAKIHTHFQQTGTATGRLSSTDPNLQNIPVKDEAGILIRKGFIARPNYVLMSLDYSQIELRLMAHFSGDESMIQAFKNKEDIHITTASKIFAKPISHITSQERNVAKTINFGIIYGMGYIKLAKDLNIKNNDAKEFIQTYFEVFKGVKQFIDQTKILAHKQEYVQTLLGRKRFLPDINSSNPMMVAMNERMAVNTVIQGSNADLLKQSMIHIFNAPELKEAKLLLQIHDELVFEVHEDQSQKIGKKIRDFMENVYILNVPLEASLNIASDWGSLKI